MQYEIRNANDNDTEFLKMAKSSSIFEHAPNLSNEEINKINNYVNQTIPLEIKDYKIILFNNLRIGCYLVYQHEDGVLLDEIYIESNYRSKGIGTSIIKEIQSINNIVYLWVYKENKKAIKLYQKLGFSVIEDTEWRYHMKYSR